VKLTHDPRGLAAIILAAGLSIAVVALAIGTEVTSRNLSVEEASLLSTVLGAAVGALATYMGGTALRSRGDDKDEEPPSEG
jgi:NO-binding membrane sensor protein with MHYT domain